MASLEVSQSLNRPGISLLRNLISVQEAKQFKCLAKYIVFSKTYSREPVANSIHYNINLAGNLSIAKLILGGYLNSFMKVAMAAPNGSTCHILALATTNAVAFLAIGSTGSY